MIEKVPGTIPIKLDIVGPKKTDTENFMFVPKIGIILIFVSIIKREANNIEKNVFTIIILLLNLDNFIYHIFSV